MKKFLKLLPLLIVLVLSLTVVAIATGTGDEQPDAMREILASDYLEQRKIETSHMDNDGYLGVPVDLTVYHDGSAVDGGCNGTTVILYVVNTQALRTGTDSDVNIITSMLERGYIVIVADYRNSKKAATPDLDWAVQYLMQSVKAGKIFTTSKYKTSYKECFVVPAGHNLERDRVFWQFDRHAVDGTLEKIVEVWNLDFRGMKGSYIIPWHNDGVRKETQNGFDGTEPIWYSLGTGEGQIVNNGKTYVPDEDGLYIAVKHTKANEITDCVKPDGSPIDLNLYMHIIYPTSPETSVPTLTLASSSEHLASGCVSDGRPHTNGFGFDGYAVAMYDYAYVPMARTDHYNYFDGSSMSSGSVTGDNFTYSLFTYNSALVPTAALRYLRYLSLTESKTFALNGKIGVIGNSKGSMITQLADLDLCLVQSTADGYTEQTLETFAYEYIKSFGEYYYLEGHNGETRYDMGYATYTKNGATIDGGEIQPWLTYNGTMISSGAQFVYSSCGSTTGSVDENYAPFMTSAHIGIETNGYGGNNHLVNIARYYDLTFLYFELYLGHTFLQRESSNELEIDPYVGYKNFAHYVLADAAPTVIYATPLAGGEISATPSFTVKFSGRIPASEAAKITLTDSRGTVVAGTLTSAYGTTEYTFTPATALVSGERYTLNVPSTIRAENGKELSDGYSASYYVEPGETTSLVMNETVVTAVNGLTLPLTVPDLKAYADKAVNRAELRLYVADNAANRLLVYLDDENGEYLGALSVGGIGHYALNLTDFLSTRTPGEKLTLYIKAESTAATKAPSDALFSLEDFEDGKHSFYVSTNVNSKIDTFADGHGKVLGLSPIIRQGTYNATHKYYASVNGISITGIVPDTMTTDDYGRRFLITFDVYDTDSRLIYAQMNNISNQGNGVIDYNSDRVNIQTKAGEWMSVSLLYTIEEPLYGKVGLNQKTFSIVVGPTGAEEDYIYLDNFKIQEITTDTTVASAALVLTSDGGNAYKSDSAELPFYVGTKGYATLAEAVSAIGTTNGATITLKQNVTLTDGGVFRHINAESITLDLNGYAIHTSCKSNSLISVTTAVKSITVKNGSIYLSGGALIGFEATKVAGDVTLNLERVHIGTEKGANTRELLVNDRSVGVASKVHLALYECTVDMRESRFTKNPTRMLPTGTANLDISSEMHGGAFYFSRFDKTTFLSTINDMIFYRGENGYSVLYYSAARVFPGASVITEEGFANFTLCADAVAPQGYIALAPEATELLSTPYGIIPEAYADTEAYPFVVFDRDSYQFLGASDILIQDSGSGAFNTIYNKTGNYVIYLRRDFTHANDSYNIGFINSNVLVDLNGHTLTYKRGITAQSKKNGHQTNITFTNGTLNAATTNMAFITPAAVTYPQSFTLTFDEVTFTVESGTKPGWLVTRTNPTSSSSAQGFTLRVVVKDCVFDVRNATSTLNLFAIGHSTGLIDDSLTLIGSSILGELTYVNIISYQGSENRSFLYVKGEDGNYLTNTRPTASKTPDTTVLIDDEVLIFSDPIREADGMTTYALAPDPMATPYGRIPTEYADAEKYPILLFNLTTKTVVWAGNRWGGEGEYGGVMSQLHKNAGKGSHAIYFQGDFVDAKGEDGKLQPYYNSGCITGEHIIDLAGHTVTMNTQFFYSQAKNKNFTSAVSFTVKNGTIVLGNQALLAVGSNTYDQAYSHSANYLFDNVTLAKIGYSSILVRDDLGGDFNTTTNVTFRNCIFDITSGRSAALFRVNTETGSKNSTSHAIHITVEGGKFNYVGENVAPIFECGALTNKTFLFKTGKDGLPTFTSATANKVSFDTPYETNLGVRYFMQDETGGDTVTFYLCEKTAYGLIPHKFDNPEAYPFLLFNASTGKIIKGFDVWATETSESVLGYFTFNSGKLVVLLRRDVEQNYGTYKNYVFGNSKSGNTLLIDLGGYTFTTADTFMYLQARSNHELNVTVKNGTIKYVGSSSLLPIGTKPTSTTKVTNITFERVHILLSHSTGALTADTRENDSTSTVNLIFNGCIIETGKEVTAPIFYLGQNATLTNVHIFVNGGEIRLGRALFNIFTDGGKANKSITFSRYEGAFTKITLPSGFETDTLTLPGANGPLGLLATDTANTYILSETGFVSAYLNLTNDLNLVYRIFLTYGMENPTVTFTIGDTTVTVKAYTRDENGLYLFRLPSITPAKMGETVTATLTATYNGETVTVMHNTLSVKSYAESLKAQYPSNTALLELIDKLLVYGAAAQQYLGESDLITEIGAMGEIPEEKNAIRFTGTASELASFTKLGMRLEGAIALRLTVKAQDATGLVLTVTKGGASETLTFDKATRRGDEYVFLYEGLLANELDEEITFTVTRDGETVGKTLTLTANAYLYRTAQGGDTNLATLAKALYAYGESAKNYK